MRTTLAIDDDLLARAKTRARDRGMTLGGYVESAIRKDLSALTADRVAVVLPVSSATGGPRAGVDLTTNRSLYDAMEANTT